MKKCGLETTWYQNKGVAKVAWFLLPSFLGVIVILFKVSLRDYMGTRKRPRKSFQKEKFQVTAPTSNGSKRAPPFHDRRLSQNPRPIQKEEHLAALKNARAAIKIHYHQLAQLRALMQFIPLTSKPCLCSALSVRFLGLVLRLSAMFPPYKYAPPTSPTTRLSPELTYTLAWFRYYTQDSNHPS